MFEFSDVPQSDLQPFPPRMSHESVLALQFRPTGLKFTLTQQILLKKSCLNEKHIVF